MTVKDISTMSEKEKAARAKAFEWLDTHTSMIEEARKLTLLEDLEIGEIIDWIEDEVYGDTVYPVELIKELEDLI